MKRIKQLSKHLINQIAAGEVIERPASVVKELVENSIDAKAKKISIEVTNDCRDLRIADNGSGIHPDDIMLAFSKHATSKIESDEDLFAISTLGFRGEALSSIISISNLTCTTRTKDFDYGTKVECANSNVSRSQTGCAVGTIMNVKNLFFNVPARLKFLRSPKTEFSYIQELIQSLALINPQISFELKNNGKIMLKTSGLGDLKQTVCEVYSKEVADNLKEVEKEDKISNIKIYGYVSTPDFTRSSKKGYHLYINSRVVKCPVFQKSIDMAYKNLLGSGKYPFVILNLQLLPEDVDVNVHPTKKEVRYKNPNQIFNFIYSAINFALSSSSFTPINHNVGIISQKEEKEEQISEQVEQAEIFKFETLHSPQKNVEDEVRIPQDVLLNTNFADDIQVKTPVLPKNFDEKALEKEAESLENIIGQYKNTYILIEKEEGLEIVDQHIAEERFNYEKLQKQKSIASQMLFISDLLQVSASEYEQLNDFKQKIESFGYEIQFLKDNQITFKKVPQVLAQVNPKVLLSDILENLSGDLDGLEENMLKTIACKASVKAGQKLNLWQMQQIIKNWRTCEKPYTCPHGRPISKMIAHKQIAGFFDRNY